MVEFVSANPTGPLHVGHAPPGGARRRDLQPARDRRAGRSRASSITTTPACRSRRSPLRCRRAHAASSRATPAGPRPAYNGDYIADIAADFLAGKTVTGRRPRVHRLAATSTTSTAIRQFAVAYLRHEQDLDLQAFGVRFDNYYLESSLYTERPGRRDRRSACRRRQDLRARTARCGCAPPTTATTRTA